MSQLIRLDETGHTVLAEWGQADQTAFAAAADTFAAQLACGFFGIVSHPDGRAEQVTALPLDAPTVILRRPIAGG
jgi:hypothetical protein